jgi:hypothetical protein
MSEPVDLDVDVVDRQARLRGGKAEDSQGLSKLAVAQMEATNVLATT